MELSIKPCSPSDIDDLVRISRDTFTAAFAAQNDPEDFQHYLSTALSEETLLSELQDPHSQFLFVFFKDSLAGYFKCNEEDAQTDLKDPRALELERIYVLPKYQKLGIGKFMVREVIRLARQGGKDYIWLGVWEKNLRAIAFYESLGFEKFGRHPYYIGKDKQMDWLMRLDLPTL